MRYKILIIYDVSGWAYHRRATALKKYAPEDFDVEICNSHEGRRANLGNYQLVFNLDYMTRGYDRIIQGQGLDTILVVSHNRDSKSRLEYFPDSYNPVQQCGFLIINNLECFDYHERLPHTCNISNGVDTDIWKCLTPIEEREKRVIWTGSGNIKKAKGWHDILRHLMTQLEKRGFIPEFRPFPNGGNLQAWAWPTEKMLEWYNSAFAVVCASEHEGTPNTTLEGMTCGCVPVSTNVGNIREFGRDKENCVICERKIVDFVAGIEYAWEHRKRLSDAARETMKPWAYEHRAKYFFFLFRRLIDDGPASVEPFSYTEVEPEEI